MFDEMWLLLVKFYGKGLWLTKALVKSKTQRKTEREKDTGRDETLIKCLWNNLKTVSVCVSEVWVYTSSPWGKCRGSSRSTQWGGLTASGWLAKYAAMNLPRLCTIAQAASRCTRTGNQPPHPHSSGSGGSMASYTHTANDNPHGSQSVGQGYRLARIASLIINTTDMHPTQKLIQRMEQYTVNQKNVFDPLICFKQVLWSNKIK